MKAEHRKELETNVLADKMGKLITGAKQGPSRGFVFYLLAGLFVVVVIFGINRWINYSAGQSSKLWLRVEDGDLEQMKVVYQAGVGENPGKVARLQFAWEELWVYGIKRLGGNPALARASIEQAREKYTELAKACEGDPVFHPEALYGLAVIEETGLIDKANRDSGVATVVDKYKAVSKANKESAFAAMARQRVNDLEDETKSREILRFYAELDDKLKGLGQPGLGGLPGGLDLESLLKKKGG